MSCQLKRTICWYILATKGVLDIAEFREMILILSSPSFCVCRLVGEWKGVYTARLTKAFTNRVSRLHAGFRLGWRDRRCSLEEWRDNGGSDGGYMKEMYFFRHGGGNLLKSSIVRG